MATTIRSSTLAWLIFMLALLFYYGTAHPMPEDYGQSPLAEINENQDDPILVPEVMEEFDSQSGRPITNPEELRNLARLYQLIQLQYQKQQQYQQDRQANQRVEGEALPIALTLVRPQEGQNKDEDKRTSYMSLCHFKICNMGRKRNTRWNTKN